MNSPSRLTQLLGFRLSFLFAVSLLPLGVISTLQARTLMSEARARSELAPGRTDHGRLIWTREMQAGHYAECDLSRCLRRALTRDVGSRKERTL